MGDKTVKIEDLAELTDKKLRTVRNNLNNRVEHCKENNTPKELQPSHMLHGLSLKECIDLKEAVLKELDKRK